MIRPKLDVELRSKFITLECRGSRRWTEFGLGVGMHACLTRNTIDDRTMRESTATCLHVNLLWFRAAIWFWI